MDFGFRAGFGSGVSKGNLGFPNGVLGFRMGFEILVWGFRVVFLIGGSEWDFRIVVWALKLGFGVFFFFDRSLGFLTED